MIALRTSLAATAVFASLALCALPARAVPPSQAGRVSQAALVETVRAREIAFARTMADRDPVAFARFISRDAVFIGGERPLHGPAEVAAAWASYFKGAQAPFSWRPEQVQVTADGKLAITMGPTVSADGRLMGHFNSTWRLERDGQWRVVLDNGWDACRDSSTAAARQ